MTDSETVSLLNSSPEDGDMIILNIKTLRSMPFQVEIDRHKSLREFKEIILDKSGMKEKYIRLIYQGKMLVDDSATLDSYKVQTNSFIHCAITNSPCKVENTSSDQEEQPPRNNRGFDRLRIHLSAEEVQALRLHFYPQVASLVAQSEPREGESTEDRVYRVEEEWMESQGPQSEFALNVRPASTNSNSEHRIEIPSSDLTYSWLVADNDGNLADLFWGLLMGLLLGFILLFWLWERSVPRKQKLGILVGVTLNILISLAPSSLPA